MMVASQGETSNRRVGAEPRCAYLVSFGKNGAVGSFGSDASLLLNRGDRVLVETARGHEVGRVLCLATPRHLQMLGQEIAGRLLRPITPQDENSLENERALAERMFAESRRLAREMNLPLEVVDVEVLFGADRAVVECLADAGPALTSLLDLLGERFGVRLFLEDLALETPPAEEAHGCNKPDCGRKLGGTCTSCGSGEGGCSSCGGSGVDLRQYFAHLRSQMEAKGRMSLV